VTDSVELLLLRLALFAIVFGTCALIVLSLRASYLPATRSESGPPPAWRLVLEAPGESGLPRGTSYRLASVMEIGRDNGAAIVVGDPSVSASHARLERQARGWLVRDLGSTNGTLVDGRPLPPAGALLSGGERLQLGAVVFRLVPPER
jgi:hypothetical protein